MTNNQLCHRKQYAHNKKFCEDVLKSFKSEYNDWVITSLFYSVLHLINAYCVKHHYPTHKNHIDRGKFVQNTLKQIFPEYHRIYLASMGSRYAREYSDVVDSEVFAIKKDFNTIVTHIGNV